MKRKHVILSIGIISLLILLAAGCSGKKAGGEKGSEKKIAYYRDPMNPAITVDHPGKAPCGMDYVPVYAGDASIKGIHIDSAVVQNIGVMTEEVKKRELKKEIRTSGTVDLNESAVYTISIKFMGWADKLHISYTGEHVTRGSLCLTFTARNWSAPRRSISKPCVMPNPCPRTPQERRGKAAGNWRRAAGHAC